MLPGYGWLFPVDTGPEDGRRLLNIGVGFMAAETRVMPSIRSVFESFVRELRRSAEFRQLELTGPLLAGALRSFERVPDARLPNVLFVGDAAGLINPISGEGITAALQSGELAGRFATECGGKSATDDLYDRYASELLRRQQPLFRLFKPFLSEGSIGWRLTELMLESERPSFIALRRTWGDVFAGTTRSEPVDEIGRIIAESLSSLPSYVTELSVERLRRARGNRLARVFEAVLGDALEPRDRDIAAMLSLVDTHGRDAGSPAFGA